MLVPYQGVLPRVHETAVLMPGIYVIGDVEIGEETSVWFGAVLRGDVAPIKVGQHVSIQDGTIVHCEPGCGTTIGNYVTIGHSAVVHACTIHDNALIGMNATVLDGAVVGQGSIVAAGCVVAPGTIVPPLSLIAGVPGKVIRQLSPESQEERIEHAKRYAILASRYRNLQTTIPIG